MGFTGFSSKPASADFSFLKDVSTTPKTNGIGSQDTSKPNPFAQNNSLFGSTSTSDITKTVPKFTFSASEPDKYYSRLKGLNESVSKWIVKKVEENPLISLQPIFKDYEKYLAEIESESGNKSTNSAPAVPAFNFSIPNTNKTIPGKHQDCV